MSSRRAAPFVDLLDELSRRFPDIGGIAEAAALVAAGDVLVSGRVVANPAARVRRDESISVRRRRPLRGSLKLAAALDGFAIDVAGRTALDLGASTGGFTTALLEAGADRVVAVDAGHGQLLGRLRQDDRVRNLEGVNLGSLDLDLVPEVVDVVTLDLSFLSLAAAVPQVAGLRWAADADLVALVKPMYELGLDAPPDTPEACWPAVEAASAGLAACGWSVEATMDSPIRGGRGAIEFLIHAIPSRSVVT